MVVKEKEVRTYTMRIEELVGEVKAKEREVEMYRL